MIIKDTLGYPRYLGHPGIVQSTLESKQYSQSLALETSWDSLEHSGMFWDVLGKVVAVLDLYHSFVIVTAAAVAGVVVAVASLTKCSNIDEELKDDNKGIEANQANYDHMEPVVMQGMLHASTPTVGGDEGGGRGERRKKYNQ